jgi:hypothetical protein
LHGHQKGEHVPRKANTKPELVGFLGVGLDHKDGHKRITQGEEFLLVGGSEETHERMQDVAIHITESLQQRGKRLKDVSVEEVIELLHEARER